MSPFNSAKTHCKWGHEFTPENTYFNAATNTRTCRACRRERMTLKRPRKQRIGPPKRLRNADNSLKHGMAYYIKAYREAWSMYKAGQSKSDIGRQLEISANTVGMAIKHKGQHPDARFEPVPIALTIAPGFKPRAPLPVIPENRGVGRVVAWAGAL